MNIQDICTACPERLIAVAFGCEVSMTNWEAGMMMNTTVFLLLVQ